MNSIKNLINISRLLKLSRKFASISLFSLRFTAIIGRNSGPKIIINSIPKSGTNLVEEILKHFPLMRGKIQRTLLPGDCKKDIEIKIKSLKNGQFIPAHLFYSQELINIIKNNNIKVLFITRDLRDSLLSHINYLSKIDFFHKDAKIFKNCKTLDEKLDIYLNGNDLFLPWKNFVDNYRQWSIDTEHVLNIRFEDIIDYNNNPDLCSETLLKMSYFLNINNIDIEYIMSNMVNKKGLTYSSPSKDKFKKILSPQQIELVTMNLKDQLEFFGYH